MRTIYVDVLKGRDTNAGSTPDRAWKSLKRVSRERWRAGDRVLLKRGQVWKEPLRLKGSGRRGAPITVAGYGSGPKPRIAAAASPVVGNDGPVSWWVLRDLDVCGARAWDPHGQEGERHGGIVFSGSRLMEGLLVEDCVVHDVAGAGIAFWAGDSNTTVFRGWTVRRCEVYHAATGITNGGPWPQKGDRTPLSPAFWHYHDGCRVVHCSTHHIGTDGIVLSHCRYTVIERCTAYRTGIGRTKRTPVGIWFFQAYRCVIQYCESYDNHTAGGHADGGGFDLDGGALECVMQYNYSHDNDGAGYLICSYDPKHAPTERCVTRFNLSVNDGRANDYPAILYWQADHCPSYNNTCITRISPALKFISPTKGNEVTNNLFVVDAKADVAVVKSAFPLTWTRFRNNLYWRTGGKARFEVEAHKALDFRAFEARVGGRGETCAEPRLTALRGRDLRLGKGSPAAGSALRLRSMGSVDFAERPLPATGKLPRGALL